MISEETIKKYTPTIGIECHIQFRTKTKLFAGVDNDARGAEPNTKVSQICFGLPGTLPVLNEKAIEYGSRMAFAFGTKPQKFSKFDRKHYFYPDLPKGYQITQFDQPIVLGGHVDIEVDGKKKKIGITRAHLEEDAGKNTHPAGSDYSLVDLNRAGTPLLEVVSEPEIHTAQEARAFAQELYLLAKYSGVSDADLYHGNMRFDVNVSVSKTKELGTRSETKNLNSFKSVEKAVEYEIKRQIELLEKGEKIVQETRGWDDAKQKTLSQRGKEEAHDYRYFPEPDIPPVVLDDDFIKALEAEMPIMPGEWRQRLNKIGLDKSYTDTLLEAEVENESVSYLHLIEDELDKPKFARTLANWFVNVEIPLRREGKADGQLKDSARAKIYGDVHEMIQANKLSSTNAKSLIEKLLVDGIEPENVEEYAEKAGLVQVSDTKELDDIVMKVIADNKQAADVVRSGEAKAIGFLVGQVMKLSKGKANPQLAQELLKKHLG